MDIRLLNILNFKPSQGVSMTRGEERIGDVYHQKTKYRRNAMPRGGLDWAHQPSPYKEFSAALKHIPLNPPEQKGGKPIWEAIGQRRSQREFSPHPITFTELSQLLWATQGITARAWGYDFRAVPSAGALYPIETYVVVNRVNDLNPGLYHFDIKENQLIVLKEGNIGSNLSQTGLGQEMLEDASCIFIWTAIVARSRWKYRERAYRYIYMDAGHIGQNLYLAATALNLGCCTVGAFYDEEVDQLIGIEGGEEISIYLGAVGRIK
jgi:SagB-type dehydrogenase family enzyme